jgi:tetratricopeptide (TPR) repeat protein
MQITEVELNELRGVAQSLSSNSQYGSASVVYQAAFAVGGKAEDLLNAAVSARLGKLLNRSATLFDHFFGVFGAIYPACMEAGLAKLELGLNKDAADLFRSAKSLKNTAHANLWLGVSLKRSGDIKSALEYLHAALQLDQNLVSASVEIGACHEALGDFTRAAEAYQSAALADDSPHHTYALNRLGLCLLQLRDDATLAKLLCSEKYKAHLDTDYAIASTILWSIKLNEPIHDEIILEKAKSNNLKGNRRMMFDALTIHLMRETKHDYFTRKSFVDLFSSDSYGKDALEIMRAFSQDIIPRALSSADLIPIDKAIQVLVDKIASQTPFSLIRIGDGEGNFLARGLIPENTFIAEQCHKILGNWFGSNSTDFDRFVPLYRDLQQAIAEADLLGAPDEKRMESELTRDPRGFWGVCFASYYAATYSARRQFVEASIHRSLFVNDDFLEALRTSNCLHTISCYRDFGAKVRAKLGVDKGTDLVVPGEMGIAELPQSCKVGEHYPKRYCEILGEIQTIQPRGVVLIAAGVCGKAYSAAAKRAGCIGIDIGAVADRIMGFATREYLKEPSQETAQAVW